MGGTLGLGLELEQLEPFNWLPNNVREGKVALFLKLVSLMIWAVDFL